MRNVRSNIELDEIATEYNKCLDYPVLGTLMEHFVTHTPLKKASRYEAVCGDGGPDSRNIFFLTLKYPYLGMEARHTWSYRLMHHNNRPLLFTRGRWVE